LNSSLEVFVNDVVSGNANLPATEQPLPDAPILAGNLKFDPLGLVDIFWRHLWAFLGVFALIFGAAVTYVTLTTRHYVALTTIQIEPQHSDPVEKVGVTLDKTERPREAEYVDTQAVILASPEIAEAAIKSLNLVNLPEFAFADPAATAEDRHVYAVRKLSGMITVRHEGATSLLDVEVTTDNANLSIQIANELARQYLIGQNAKRNLTDTTIASSVAEKVNKLQVEARDADAAVMRYKIAHNMASSQGATMAEQETTSLNQQIANARATLAQARGRLEAAQHQAANGGGGGDTSAALNSGTIGGLRQREADSSQTLAQLEARYGPKFPAVIEERQKLADLRQQIQAEINRIQKGIEGEETVAQSGLNSLLASQATAEGKLSANTSAQVGLLDLQSKADAAKLTYQQYLTSAQSATAHNGVEPPTASVASEASPSTVTVKPNTFLVLVIGGLLAVVGGVAAVFAADAVDVEISSRKDIESRLGVRYLGAVPLVDARRKRKFSELSAAPEAMILASPLSAFAESIRNLRTAITMARGKRPGVIAVTSALPGEGKSTTAMCLARMIAMSGESVVIVDCDLRRRQTSLCLLGDRDGRLLDVLAGRVDAISAVVKDQTTDLMVLGISHDVDGAIDPINPTTIAALVAQLRQHFTFVIFDTAPVLGVADARIVAQASDACVLLARWRKTSLRAVDMALSMLVSARAPVAGIALTLVDISKFGSTRDDHYGYRKEFRGYYRD
jgi:succinoglycan biosynthesis transport protein ExoP